MRLFKILILITLFFSCQPNDDHPIPDDEGIEFFLSARVDDLTFNIQDEELIVSNCHMHPDFEAWQVNFSASSPDGRRIELFIKYYFQSGEYYTGTNGNGNWMCYTEKSGENFGTIPVWWSGENDFIGSQLKNEQESIKIFEGDGYMEGVFEFTGYSSGDDFKNVTEGKFRIPFSRE